jgi:Asp-tRNA(Asn)/Glu-tRNA(Gln) amidotransferase A subunit family amidase
VIAKVTALRSHFGGCFKTLRRQIIAAHVLFPSHDPVDYHSRRMARTSPTRRKVLKNLAAVGVVASGATALAQSKPAATTSTSLPTTAPVEVSAADVEGLDRVLGHEHTPPEREMMRGGIAAKRDMLKSLRKRTIPPDVEPAIQFDPRLPDTKVPEGKAAFAMSEAELPSYDGDPASLAFASAADLSRLIHAKKVTSFELTRMYLARLKEHNPALLCVVNLTEDRALEQAKRADVELAAGKDRGPLHGIPYGAKDLLATKGIPTTWGASPYEKQVFEEDATVIRQLEKAGAVLLAKLSLGELAMGDVWFGGQTRNPWRPNRGSGGSSAGPASATAGGLVGFSIGSETLGSIINPCMICGTTGLRPTYGRVSRHGAMPLARTMDKIGAITRGVEDLAMVFSAISGADGVPFVHDPKRNLKSLRVGMDALAFNFGAAHFKDEATRIVYQDALALLKRFVGELVPVKLPPTENYTGLASLIIAAESASSFTELVESGRIRELKQQEEGSWPNTFRVGATIPASDYLRAMQVRTQLMREMADAMNGLDCYVTIPYVGPTIAYTNLTGHPSLITRCGMRDGRHRMIEFVGNLYREDAILPLAHALERENNFNSIWPSLV